MNNILEEVKKHFKERRLDHTLGVRDTALYLAELWGGDKDKVERAALYHDWAKALSDQELLQKAKEFGIELSLYDQLMPQVLHAPVSAYMVRELFKEKDEEVLRAISSHTLGNEAMTLTDKIIYLADMIEPNRDYPGVIRIREIAEANIDEALLLGFDSTISFLLEEGKFIHPQTILSRNSLLKSLRG